MLKREIDVQLLEEKLQDTEFLELARNEPDTAMKQLKLSPKEDVVLYRITVGVLGIVGLVAAFGALWLGLVGQEIPELLVALGSAAIGALAGLLAPFSA